MKQYLCGVSFQYELGHTNIYGFVFDTVEELKNSGTCWEQCGIVEIETEGEPEAYTSFKWIEEQDKDWG